MREGQWGRDPGPSGGSAGVHTGASPDHSYVLVLLRSGPSLMARSWRSTEQKQFHMTAELSVTLMEQGPNKRVLGPCLNQPECEHCPSPPVSYTPLWTNRNDCCFSTDCVFSFVPGSLPSIALSPLPASNRFRAKSAALSSAPKQLTRANPSAS